MNTNSSNSPDSLYFPKLYKDLKSILPSYLKLALAVSYLSNSSLSDDSSSLSDVPSSLSDVCKRLEYSRIREIISNTVSFKLTWKEVIMLLITNFSNHLFLRRLWNEQHNCK
jgi:hypothetical protein